jgi:hydrogenase nickel incorporation protein HypB
MPERIKIVENIMNANDRIAFNNRQLLDQHGIYSINLMASPGSGKTSFILSTIKALPSWINLGVVEGDTAPVTIDADKISAFGKPVIQINTGGECHLDAIMIENALAQLPLEVIDFLIVENVGNLICPAAFKLGTHINVLIASIPEGDDKPYKYPNIYRGLDILIINKIDLLPYVNFNLDYFKRGVEILNPGLKTFEVSCKTSAGIDLWIDWICDQISNNHKAC